jgi:hypothetical protein
MYQGEKSETSVLQKNFEVRREYNRVREVRKSRFFPLIMHLPIVDVEMKNDSRCLFSMNFNAIHRMKKIFMSIT